MKAKEIAQKYVHGLHDALTDNQEIKDLTDDILTFAKTEVDTQINDICEKIKNDIEEKKAKYLRVKKDVAYSFEREREWSGELADLTISIKTLYTVLFYLGAGNAFKIAGTDEEIQDLVNEYSELRIKKIADLYKFSDIQSLERHLDLWKEQSLHKKEGSKNQHWTDQYDYVKVLGNYYELVKNN